jgi:hypothetical protein
MATIPLSMLIAASSPYGRSAPCGTPIVAITAQTIHQSSSGVRRRAASARTLAPIGSGKAASGHSKANSWRPNTRGAPRSGALTRPRRGHDPSSATTSSGCFVADAG